MKRVLLAIVASLSVLSFTPAALAQQDTSPAPQGQIEGIAATVNDEPITTLDVRNRMRLIVASSGIQPDPQSLPRIYDQALSGLIDESLQLQAASEYEIEVTDEEVNDSIRDLASRSNTTVDAITNDLRASGVDVSTLRRQLEAEIAWQILVNGRYGSRIRVSDQQITQSLERLVASASQPQYRIFEILVEIPSAQAEDQAVQRVLTILQQLQSGASFPDLARQFSDAPSARTGGDIGWIVASQLPQEVSNIMPQLVGAFEANGGRGALSNPVRVPGGFMVVALIGVRDGTTTLQYELTQVTIPAASVEDNTRAQFERALAESPTCEAAQALADEFDGAFVSQLGTITTDALLPQIRQALNPLDTGDNTGVLDTAAGLQTLLVCNREITGPGVPSRDDIAGQIRGQQLSLQARRWLRDLRRDSTIDIR
ncbi:peptidylprolyl isomerase [Maricaulis sp. D1M11]|uniref:peptidylprolyl isomerase n=1 Tax=Maricaulis sp. D1M11 TaxID=3076117 RepID=UPI0039B56A79